jgi:hypothetical protein
VVFLRELRTSHFAVSLSKCSLSFPILIFSESTLESPSRSEVRVKPPQKVKKEARAQRPAGDLFESTTALAFQGLIL